MKGRRIVSATTVAVGLAALAPAVGAAAQPARTRLRGNTPRWATAARDRGAARSTRRVSVRVFLGLRDQAGATALAQAVSDPSSPSYGQYVTPEAFRARFSPAEADVGAVKAFLTGAGLTVGEVPANNAYVEASGTVGQAEAAFGVQVHRFAYRGHLLNAPTSEPAVPAALAGKIVAVSGLGDAHALTRPLSRATRRDTTERRLAAPDAPVQAAPQHSSAAPPPDAFVNAPPCSTSFGEKQATQYPRAYGAKQPFVTCGYTPDQFQGAYGTAGLSVDGTGVRVGIVDAYAAPTILQDANTYATRHGQAPFAAGQFSQANASSFRLGYDDPVTGDICGEQGWYGEETLDVEAVHGMAPGAKVVYSGAASCDDFDILAAVNKIVDGHLADVVSNSYGDVGEDVSQAEFAATTAVFTQAAAEGIGLTFSTGDDGDESANTASGQPVADFEATHPLATAVGGTSLGVGASKQYLFETGWATGSSTLGPFHLSWRPTPPGNFIYGGGGGASSVFAEPGYQKGVVPDAVAGGHRAIPDVAMDGDPNTGMLVGETQTFPDGSEKYGEYRIGGTSLSSPLFAGVVALADQSAGRALGFLNPKLYTLAGTAAVRDVGPSPTPRAVVRVDYKNTVDASNGTTVSLRTLDDEAQTLHTGAGWDSITGIGSPNGAAFLQGLGSR